LAIKSKLVQQLKLNNFCVYTFSRTCGNFRKNIEILSYHGDYNTFVGLVQHAWIFGLHGAGNLKFDMQNKLLNYRNFGDSCAQMTRK
jgi:hypothetical protein